ncbi:MAG: phosphoribosylformylglycinamidine synthase [Oceanococcus sp.]
MNITYYLGAGALSDFRLQALNRKLQEQGLQLLRSEWIYLAQWRGEARDESRLAQLIETDQPLKDEADQLLIAPRLGTVSPWSSKATDIASVCGLTALARIEQGRRLLIRGWAQASTATREAVLRDLHDPLTETVLAKVSELAHCFGDRSPAPLVTIDLGSDALAALARSNVELGLALSDEEMGHLAHFYAGVERNPSDAELMMFAQINSEHCRHKIFNAQWTRDGVAFEHSLFDMIRMTYAQTPQGVLSAYKDNAAILDAKPTTRFMPDGQGHYTRLDEAAAIAIKVETHNHPTAIAPDPGAATGSGGEIRDEAATGRGGKPKAGLSGFSVGDLQIPDFQQAWEAGEPIPKRLASPLQIMLDAPIGAARYNNEFGRPNLTGFFRTLDTQLDGQRWGYAKPIMIAGGLGNVRPQHAQKLRVPPGSLVVVLGGPGMLIGLGGSTASSMHAGASSEALDFASVQRANPELERRCQEVIDACWQRGDANPMLSIHDVGAGGLSNAVPEILDDNDLGGDIDLSAVLIADEGLSPMEIWCNESQERYVIAIAPESRTEFEALCARERCPYAIIGTGTAERRLHVHLGDVDVVDLPMEVLLGKQPAMQRSVQSRAANDAPATWAQGLDINEAVERVLRVPAVASKNFLITIGDRTVGGLTCRDQMVGPWQVPVADVAVTAAGYEGSVGEAMAMGECAPIAISNAPASGRMAVAEAITNIAAAPIADLSDVRFSANWMAAAGDDRQSADLLATVEAVGKEFCTALGIAIPVGKDSLSMQTRWQEGEQEHSITSPISVIITGFAPVTDVSQVSTPQLDTTQDTRIVLLELPGGHRRLGGSALAQAYGEGLGETPDVDDAAALRALFQLVQTLRQQGHVLACHDRSDGGLVSALLEMAFAGRCGLDIKVLEPAIIDRLFAEEVGMLVQVPAAEAAHVLGQAGAAGLAATVIAQPRSDQTVQLSDADGQVVWQADGRQLEQVWAETSYRLQALRDEPDCAAEEFAAITDLDDPGLTAHLTQQPQAPAVIERRPAVAILREQGVNGQVEMAWMFERAGFDPVDVHMSDILSGQRDLADFVGLAACGGFSYGDVLGAGRGWARSILLNERAREEFSNFFADTSRFALGVCNGCQMMSALRELIPGTQDWPSFERNRSEQFEARLVLVDVPENNSVMMGPMAGSRIPIAAAHGEGRAQFAQADAQIAALQSNQQVAMRYVDHGGQATERFPYNPNGSVQGITGVSSADGRVTIMMPHPERLTRAANFSWRPADWGYESPWLSMFVNARRWVD